MWALGKCPKYFREEYVEELSNSEVYNQDAEISVALERYREI